MKHTKTSKIRVFNPSNDMALAANSNNYLPPRNIMRMEEDLALLPLWWSEEGDYILLPDDSLVYVTSDLLQKCKDAAVSRVPIDFSDNVIPGHSIHSLSPNGATKCKSATGKYEFSLRTLHQVIVEPWGWSLQLLQRLLRLGVAATNLPTPMQLDTYRTLSSRSFACDFIHDIFAVADKEGWGNMLVGRGMRTVSYYDDSLFRDDYSLVFKSPWSSSGRGVIVARPDLPLDTRRIQSIIRDQGSILVDDFYDDKLLDFALEFEVEGSVQASSFNDDNLTDHAESQISEISFRGFSVFSASASGAYGYNLVEEQASLRSRILSAGIDEALLEHVVEASANLLRHHLAGRYTGPVGIDMLVCRHEGQVKLHPCIEINLRRNMGILAIELSGNFGPSSTVFLAGKAREGFSVELTEGKLQILQSR